MELIGCFDLIPPEALEIIVPMSNFQVSPKRIRPGCNVLIVICRRRRVSSSQGLKAEEANGFQKSAHADEFYKTASAFADIALRSSVEVALM